MAELYGKIAGVDKPMELDGRSGSVGSGARGYLDLLENPADHPRGRLVDRGRVK